VTYAVLKRADASFCFVRVGADARGCALKLLGASGAVCVYCVQVCSVCGVVACLCCGGSVGAMAVVEGCCPVG